MAAGKQVAIIGAALDLGAGRRGVDMGPSAIRYAGLHERLETIGYDVLDWGDVETAVLEATEETDESARDRLAGITKILLRAWRRDPDLVRVLVREVTRSSHLQERIEEIDAAFAGLERIIARGQREGEFRSDLDPRMASYVFYGALEEILTGWVLGQLEDGDEAIARAEETVVDVICGGLAVDRETAKV